MHLLKEKPSKDEEPIIKVADWGAGHEFDMDQPDDANVWDDNEITGTRGYMSPWVHTSTSSNLDDNDAYSAGRTIVALVLGWTFDEAREQEEMKWKVGDYGLSPDELAAIEERLGPTGMKLAHFTTRIVHAREWRMHSSVFTIVYMPQAPTR